MVIIKQSDCLYNTKQMKIDMKFIHLHCIYVSIRLKMTKCHKTIILFIVNDCDNNYLCPSLPDLNFN